MFAQNTSPCLARCFKPPLPRSRSGAPLDAGPGDVLRPAPEHVMGGPGRFVAVNHPGPSSSLSGVGRADELKQGDRGPAQQAR